MRAQRIGKRRSLIRRVLDTLTAFVARSYLEIQFVGATRPFSVLMESGPQVDNWNCMAL
jgi:hypothetical protein